MRILFGLCGEYTKNAKLGQWCATLGGLWSTYVAYIDMLGRQAFKGRL